MSEPEGQLSGCPNSIPPHTDSQSLRYTPRALCTPMTRFSSAKNRTSHFQSYISSMTVCNCAFTRNCAAVQFGCFKQKSTHKLHPAPLPFSWPQHECCPTLAPHQHQQAKPRSQRQPCTHHHWRTAGKRRRCEPVPCGRALRIQGHRR